MIGKLTYKALSNGGGINLLKDFIKL